jgi:hypothetical protein
MTTDIIKKIDGQVQIIFEKTDDGRVFRDAIWMPEADYDSTPSDDIETLKQERFDNWLAIVNAMPTELPDETTGSTNTTTI